MKQIVKNFNSIVKNTIFKVQNKTNDKLKISTFNKFLITFIGILFLYLFYLLIPLLYDKSWVKNSIQSKLKSEFKINLDYSSDITYRILPSPHFFIKDSKILSNDSKKKVEVADIKYLRIFLSQKNFFNKEKMSLKRLSVNNANFYLFKEDLKKLNDKSSKRFSNKKIRINKSNIFFKDSLNEIIAIVKIDNATLFFDDKKLLNLFNLKGNIFKIPFTYKLKNTPNIIKKKKFSFEAKSLNLSIENESVEKKNTIIGKNIVYLLNSRINTKYKIIDKNISFTSNNSRINSSKINYNGQVAINPFDLDLNINLGDYKISKLFDLNSILLEFLRSELLFNDNISLNTSIIINSSANEEIFDEAKIYFNILNSRINFNNTKFINTDIGSLAFTNSNLFLKKKKLILNSDLLFEIKNSKRLFSTLNTDKKFRKEFKNIFVNFEYDFLSNTIKFNNAKIDNNQVSDQFLNIIDGFTDINSINLIKIRRLLNKLLSVYAG